MLGIIILAGGESRRMGRPKALLPFPAVPSDQKKSEAAPRTFLCHLIEATRHPRTGILRVVVGAHAKEISERAKLDADELVMNEGWQRGQLSSLQAGIRSLPVGTEGIVVCLVDHPVISSNLVSEIIAAFDEAKNKIVIPTYNSRRGHPVIFPSTLYEELLAAPAEIGARSVVRAHSNDVLEVPVDEEGVVLNLNDPESLEKLPNL